MSPEELKSIVRRCIEEGWNNGNMSIFDQYYAPNYTYQNSAFPQARNLDGVKKVLTQIRSSYPDFRFTIEEMIAEGDKVAARLTFRGTDKGGSVTFGTPSTGKKVAMPLVSISRFSGDKVVEDWALQDNMGLMQQLGVIPKAGAVK